MEDRNTIVIDTPNNNTEERLEAKVGFFRIYDGNPPTYHFRNIWHRSVAPMMGSKDPMTDGLTDFFKRTLKGHKCKYLIMIEDTPFLVTNQGKWMINGRQLPLKRLSYVLGKTMYKSVFEKDSAELTKYSMELMDTPIEVTYVLENRMPYRFYESGVGKTEVRLNVVRIGDRECAVEIGDGLWGNMSFSDVKSFCLAYDSRKPRTNKWSHLSPSNLFTALTGKEMDVISSDYKVLISFLKQNRTQKIVEERAKELVMDISKKYDNIEVLVKGDILAMLVKGRENYWKVEGNSSRLSNQNGRQNVRSYVLQNNSWQGPICIDNANTHSSLGDQLVARALPMMNDHILKKMVYTVSSYVKEAQVDKITFEQLIANEKGEGYEEVQSL